MKAAFDRSKRMLAYIFPPKARSGLALRGYSDGPCAVPCAAGPRGHRRGIEMDRHERIAPSALVIAATALSWTSKVTRVV